MESSFDSLGQRTPRQRHLDGDRLFCGARGQRRRCRRELEGSIASAKEGRKRGGKGEEEEVRKYHFDRVHRKMSFCPSQEAVRSFEQHFHRALSAQNPNLEPHEDADRDERLESDSCGADLDAYESASRSRASSGADQGSRTRDSGTDRSSSASASRADFEDEEGLEVEEDEEEEDSDDQSSVGECEAAAISRRSPALGLLRGASAEMSAASVSSCRSRSSSSSKSDDDSLSRWTTASSLMNVEDSEQEAIARRLLEQGSRLVNESQAEKDPEFLNRAIELYNMAIVEAREAENNVLEARGLCALANAFRLCPDRAMAAAPLFDMSAKLFLEAEDRDEATAVAMRLIDVHLEDGSCEDALRACRDYERKISDQPLLSNKLVELVLELTEP